MGRQLADYTQFTVPPNGLEINVGNTSGYLSVVVDTVAGQATGTGIKVQISGLRSLKVYTLAYGAPALTVPFQGNLIRVTGAGAVIELIVDTDRIEVSPTVLTPGTVAVSGTVNTDFGQSALPGDIATATGAVAGAVYALGGPPPTDGLAVGVQDPAQVPVGSGKAVPVKTET